jgi:hypothetical protein
MFIQLPIGDRLEIRGTKCCGLPSCNSPGTGCLRIILKSKDGIEALQYFGGTGEENWNLDVLQVSSPEKKPTKLKLEHISLKFPAESGN